MAKADIKMPNEFLENLSKLGNRTDEIIEDVLKVGGEILEQEVRSQLYTVIASGTKYPSRTTGTLIGSLGVSPVNVDKSGNYNIKVGFSEPRESGVSNAKIANIIEYGKSGQSAKPFLKPAQSRSKKRCIEAMKSRLESEMNSL